MTIEAPNVQWPQGFPFLGEERGTEALGVKDLVPAVPEVIVATEDFEGGVAGVGDWTITVSNPHTGINCLRSAVIGNNQQSNQVFNIPVGATHLRFWHRVSSENNFDWFRVLVDAVQVFQLSGTANVWAQLIVPLGAATTVTFRYIKDSSASVGFDAAFIDDLEWYIPGVAAVQQFEPFHLNIDNEVKVTLGTAVVETRELDCATDSVTVCITDPVVVDQGTSPWVVSGTVSVNEPVSVDDNGGSLTVDAIDLDIRSLDCATDSIEACQGTDPWIVSATATGTLANGAQTAVAAAAVQVLAANTNRKACLIQNVGLANVRVGVSGVTTTSGFRLVPGQIVILEMPFVPTQAIFAIREGPISSTVLAQEIT